MPVAFNAAKVTNSREHWGWLTAFEGFPLQEGEATYLLLQRQHSPAEQDIRLGHDAPHIELSTQRRSWYGGIAQAELARDRLSLHLNGEAALVAEDPGPIEVVFSIGAEDFLALRNNLVSIFNGCTYLEAGT